MAILTDAGLALIAAKQAAELNLAVDQFVLANIDALDTESTPPGSEVMPDPGDIVYQGAVTQAAYVNPNTVVYSLLLSTAVGPFDFNWIGLYSSADDVLVAVNYVPIQTKKQTTGGLMGNTLTKNFAIQFANAADLTGVVIEADTWQIDFTARVKQIDERERLSNFDLYGTKTFFDTAFEVVKNVDDYDCYSGVCYIDGIRIERDITAILGDVGSLPTDIYVDAVLEGDITGREAQYEIQISQTTLNHYVDEADQQHYVERIATINADGSVTDRRDDGTDGKLSGFSISDISGLQAALDGKSSTGHGHLINDVSGLQAALDLTRKGRLIKFLTTSGSLTINESANDTVEAYLTSNEIKSGKYLVVAYGAGGGGAGVGNTYGHGGGGGGGGGVSRGVITIDDTLAYIIGAGGAGSTGTASTASDGGDTTIDSLVGGGGGGGKTYGYGNYQGGIGGTGNLKKGQAGTNGSDSLQRCGAGTGGGPSGGQGVLDATPGEDGGLASGGGGCNYSDNTGTGGDGGDGYIEIYEWE